MEFSEEIAAKVAKEQNIDPKTIRVWKSRGKIPDRYLKAGFVKTEKPGEEDQKRQARIVKILSLPDIRPKAFEKYVSSSAKIYDTKLGRSNFTLRELDSLEGGISDLKAEISGILRDDRRFLDKFQLRVFKLLARPEIVLVKLLEDTGGMSREEYRKVHYAISKKEAILESIAIVNRVVEALRKLYVQIQ